MSNTWQPNEQTLNGSASSGVIDWEANAPEERQRVFVLDIGSLQIPISSAQSSMRLAGQSFLQVVVPNGGEYIDGLSGLVNETMLLRSGYRYADGTLSPLEIISAAPFEQVVRDEGAQSDSLTLSGYGTLPPSGENLRKLIVRSRNTAASGRRRLRCALDLFLKPGHMALDIDGTQFKVGVIQYFINSSSDFMEVIQDG